MICISIADIGIDKIKYLLPVHQLVEFRLDLMKLNYTEIEKLIKEFSDKIILTPKHKIFEKETLELIGKSINYGVKYIDFDYQSINSVPEISDFKAKLSGHLIISYHNFIETPSNEQLNFLIKDIELQKPEIIKICCKVNNINDIIRLLKLYNDYPQLGLIAFDLGENASLTRVLAKLKGAPFIYASIDEENKTEPSQISYDNILKLMEILKND